MKSATHSRQRCAIYTRKSTEHNLDLAFNSLDAQREACEAYIKSQAHEGWKLIPDRYDDGAFSGASLDRNALQALLEQVRQKKIDIIVVYKVDRLTRSLADFAKLVELFDAHAVSFVSVTQSFNTTTSMGRLTLNVLLSFAQFEREVIGERVRDKIAASKRKGIWVGGSLPLGYCNIDKKLQIIPEDAAVVRKIFADYLRVGSVRQLAASLEQEGVRPKGRIKTTPRSQELRFSIGALFYLLKNRIYVGEIVYRQELFAGEHKAIIDRQTFDAVQARLQDQSVERSALRRSSPSLLAGKIFDDRANLMTPTHANKRGIRYRYYVSQALLQGRQNDAGTIARVSAPGVEGLVTAALRVAKAADENSQIEDYELTDQQLQRVIVHRTQLMIHIRSSASDEVGSDSAETSADTVIAIPFTPSLTPRKGIIHSPADCTVIDASSRAALLNAMVRAKEWVATITTDSATDFQTIASSENLGVNYVRRLAALAYVSPKVVEAIAEGRAPGNPTPTRLLNELPVSWAEQEKLFLQL